MPRAEFTEELRRRRFDLAIRLLRIYNYYRVFVGLCLLLLVQQNLFGTRLGSIAPSTFQDRRRSLCGLQSAGDCVGLAASSSASRRRQLANFALVFVDILFLVLLIYLSGGVSSGLAGILLITVAFGAIIVTGRTSTLLAALAIIALLYSEFVLSLRVPETQNFFQAGILGVLAFALSLTIQGFSSRLRDNDERTLTQAAELADLERINRQIVQRMRTGIILVDPDNRIRMANQSALSLLAVQDRDEIARLPEEVEVRLNQWRDDTRFRPAPFQSSYDTPEIRINFFAVRSDDPNGDVTIFIEDTGEIQQQAQQLKLASLARLSGSIAHEIRNPLSAVNHAAQLLGESQQLEKGDRRLTEIIRNHCQRMNGVIENVLEVSRRQAPNPERIALAPLLTEFVTIFKESGHPEAIIDINVDPEDTEVRIDPSQLEQVLTNLAANGLRYSEMQTGRAYLRLHGGIDQRTDRPFLNIIDEGTGIDEDKLANLFEPFYTTETQGTGLGLYISRELCEANQARLTYERANNGGSCFRINFAHPDRLTSSD